MAGVVITKTRQRGAKVGRWKRGSLDHSYRRRIVRDGWTVSSGEWRKPQDLRKDEGGRGRIDLRDYRR